MSHKGVHFAATQYGFSGGHGFWEDELDTDLTQAPQSTEVLHISIPCNSETHKVITSGDTGACAGQMASVCNLNISPATAGSAAGQAAPLRRVPGFTEPLNDLAPVARSSPRRAASVPSPLMAGNHVSFFGKIFRQIIPLSIRYTPMTGTPSFIQAPRVHTSGVSGPQPRAASNRFARAEEAALGVSLNAQSQAPDIPGVSSRAAYPLRAYMHELLASFNAQATAPDIHFLSLRAYMEDLLASFNAQEQAPDDIHAQDRQWAPYISVENSRHCSPVPPGSPTKHAFPTISLQMDSPDRAQELFNRILISSYLGVSRIELHVCCLWIPFVSHGVVCFHSVGLGCSWILSVIIFKIPRGSTIAASSNAQDQAPDDFHVQDRQRAPCIFVEIFRHCRQEPARLPTKQDIPHLSRHPVSQDSAQELFERILILPYQGGSRIEFQWCCLGIPFVSQGVVCFHSVGLGVSWTFTVIVFKDPRGSTLLVSMYISLVFSPRRFA